jgi:hypothetical protein
MKSIWYERLLHLFAGIAIGYLIFKPIFSIFALSNFFPNSDDYKNR